MLCLGCGLEQDATTKRLGVKLCTNGGINCATAAVPSPDGCTDGLYVDPDYFGCGIRENTAGNGVEADVQGQASNTTVPLADAQDCDNNSPNCNGLVCTDQGLWAPPKTYHAGSFVTRDDSGVNIGGITTLQQMLQPWDTQGTRGTSIPAVGDQIVAEDGNHRLMRVGIENRTCYRLDGFSFGHATISFEIHGGELWRFRYWESLENRPTPPNTAVTPISTTVVWNMQDQQFVDGRDIPANQTRLVSVNLFDLSAIGADPGEVVVGEVIITANRLISGPQSGTNNVAPGGGFWNREYSFTASASCSNLVAGQTANTFPIVVADLYGNNFPNQFGPA